MRGLAVYLGSGGHHDPNDPSYPEGRRRRARSGTIESYQIDFLPPATYELFVTRATPDGSGGYAYATGPTTASTVTAGATTPTPLTAP
ncbi:MAG TPA: hypothetical protein VFL83_03980 [Anaeromyxobacter sp.]|nr:hypothetical protein [Anaeromyxobacter sp.]